ncbi:MAG: NlpC/P60 family protein [Myxococcota bacterium]
MTPARPIPTSAGLLAAVAAVAVCLFGPAARADDPRLATCDGRVDWRPDQPPDGTPPEARELATWVAQWTPAERDEVLLGERDIETLNERNTDTAGAWHDPLVPRAAAPQDGPDPIDGELNERLNEIGTRLASGEYVEDVPGAFQTLRQVLATSTPVDQLRAVAAITDIRCLPLTSGFFRGRIDHLFDRNQCSRLHVGELVRVLRKTADGDWAYVRAGHGVGWVDPSALSPAMSLDQARDLRDNRARLTVIDDWIPAYRADGDIVYLRYGTGFPVVAETATSWQILAPTRTGWDDAFVAKSPGLRLGFMPLTRLGFFTLLFSRMGDPYGWGGTGSGRDCSGLLLDTMAAFDLRLGRNSSVQATAGWTRVDISGRSDADKRAAIRAAARRGIVFLYMPGHIMVYLGELDGKAYALSAISEYLMPCPNGGKRTVRLDRVEVTDLERGRGTERTSFIERIATLSIFGR